MMCLTGVDQPAADNAHSVNVGRGELSPAPVLVGLLKDRKGMEAAGIVRRLAIRTRGAYRVGTCIETVFQSFVITQVSPHQTFPKLAMIRNGKMQEFMDDDIVPKFTVKIEQLAVEVQMTVR